MPERNEFSTTRKGKYLRVQSLTHFGVFATHIYGSKLYDIDYIR